MTAVPVQHVSTGPMHDSPSSYKKREVMGVLGEWSRHTLFPSVSKGQMLSIVFERPYVLLVLCCGVGIIRNTISGSPVH